MHTIFKNTNRNVETTKELINGIPCLIHRPKMMEGKLPTVIFYHGWYSSKEFKRFQSMVIATFGFQVISLDAPHHGERDAVDHGVEGIFQKYLWDTIQKSVQESQEFIDTIVDKFQVDETRIALLGSSMGAFSNGAIFARNRTLKCLIAWNGNYAWESSARLREMGFDISDSACLYLDKLNPVNNIENLIDRDILILHGKDDSQVPITHMRTFYERAVGKSSKEGSIIMHELEGIDHKIDSSMLECTIEWLLDNL